MGKLPLEEPDLHSFLCSVRMHWQIRALLQQLVPRGADPLLLALSPTRLCFGSALGCCFLCNKKNTPQFTCGIVINIMFL